MNIFSLSYEVEEKKEEKGKEFTHQWQSRLVHSSVPIFEQLPSIDQVQAYPSNDDEEGEVVRDDAIAYDDGPSLSWS